MKSPKFIHLQWVAGGGYKRNHRDITWSASPINDDDTRYIRVDAHEKELRLLKQTLTEAREENFRLWNRMRVVQKNLEPLPPEFTPKLKDTKQ